MSRFCLGLAVCQNFIYTIKGQGLSALCSILSVSQRCIIRSIIFIDINIITVTEIRIRIRIICPNLKCPYFLPHCKQNIITCCQHIVFTWHICGAGSVCFCVPARKVISLSGELVFLYRYFTSYISSTGRHFSGAFIGIIGKDIAISFPNRVEGHSVCPAVCRLTGCEFEIGRNGGSKSHIIVKPALEFISQRCCAC